MCGRNLRLFFPLLLSWLLLSSAFAQDTPTTSTLPADSESLSMPSADSSQPKSYLNSDGTINWQSLDEDLQKASRLANDSADQADNLQSSLKAYQKLCTDLQNTSKMADLRTHQEIELWKFLAVASSGGVVGSFFGPVGTTIGIVAGAAGGVIWYFYDQKAATKPTTVDMKDN